MKRAAVIILVLYERVLECSTGKEKRGNFFTVFFYNIPLFMRMTVSGNRGILFHRKLKRYTRYK